MSRALICCAVLLLAPASSLGAARKGHTIFQSPQLWSTIDICNTSAHPRTVGVRGSMPGSGVVKEQMFMRFQVQYRSAAGVWSYAGPGADSGFIAVGRGNFTARQAGRNFLFAPKPGMSYVLRGVVSFEWRRGTKVVRRAQKRTTAGHRSAVGADPAGFSRAVCNLG